MTQVLQTQSADKFKMKYSLTKESLVKKVIIKGQFSEIVLYEKIKNKPRNNSRTIAYIWSLLWLVPFEIRETFEIHFLQTGELTLRAKIETNQFNQLKEKYEHFESFEISEVKEGLF